MITVEFLGKFDKYNPGDTAQIERTLALRLIGLGVARKATKNVAPEEPVQEAPKPAIEKEPEPEKPKPTKKKPFRRAKKIEKAVEVEKQ